MSTPQAGAQSGAAAGAQGAQGDNSDAGQQGGQGQVVPPLVEPPPKPESLSNADLKAHPWVKEITSELAELRKEKAERERIAQEAEQKKLKEQGDFDKALQIEKDRTAIAQADALAARIDAALTRKGANVTDAFVKVAINEFDAEKYKTDFDAFAEELSKNEAYAPFFAKLEGEGGEPKPNPPGRTGVSIASGNAMTNEQLRKLETSDNPEDRKKAREYLSAFYKQHRRFPY